MGLQTLVWGQVFEFESFPGGLSGKKSHTPVWGTWVRSLIWEDSTCGRATSLRARTTEACVYLEPVLHSKRSHHSEKPTHCNEENAAPLAATRRSLQVAINK